MKKIFTVLAIVALSVGMVGGCCSDPTGVSTTKSFAFCWDKVVDVFCTNRAAIESAMETTEVTIQTIQALPLPLPPAAQTALTAAQAVIAAGQAALASATCPSSSSLATVNAAVAKLTAARERLNAPRQAAGLPLVP